MHVFMETAFPFRYKTEVGTVKISEQEDEETGRGHPVGDLPLPSRQGQKSGVFNIAWEQRKLKRISPQFLVLEDSAGEQKVGVGGSSSDPQI